MENQIVINKQMIDTLINKNLEKVFGFAVKRTENSNEAEDLTQDILLEVCRSYVKIKYYEGKEALEAWLWTVAKYRYYKWLGRKNKNSITYIEGIGTEKLKLEVNIDEKIIKNEEYNCLRREIGLLSKSYREVVVSYYVHEKKCSEIAKEMDMSVATVKWRLHEAKRMLKERIEEMKNYTERTYSPGKLNLVTKGNFTSPYSSFYVKAKAKSLLRQNILIYASKAAVTIEDISLELGVPRVYLEEDIETLEEEELLKKLSNNRYKTNFIIVTEESQKFIKPLLKEAAELLCENIMGLLQKEDFHSKLKSIDAKKSFKEIVWIIVPRLLASYFDDEKINREMPMRPHGNTWRIMGFEGGELFQKDRNKWISIRYTKAGLLQSVYGEESVTKNMLSSSEIKLFAKVIREKSSVEGLSKDEEETAAELLNCNIIKIQEGILKSNVTVFTKEQYESFESEIKKLADKLNTSIVKSFFNKVAVELSNYYKDMNKKEIEADACIFFDILNEYALEYLKVNDLISIPKKLTDTMYFVIEGNDENEKR
ncbi:RNA polymerase sigma factor [Clostridium hydrogenum]|uniref:RNA polymerase sigma factor n=1 Tax=Clostridium hydrogenum TaxID=2855764 RepID=UPI001F4572C6|nr:RNA polymerase sigma factor [Clostridium hydrogenum]